MAIKEVMVKSVAEYLEGVKDSIASWYRPTGLNPWFRGQANAEWAPRPSLFRKGGKEHDVTASFMQRAGMYTNQRLPGSPAQWLSLMQHVGVPTRLLDWTESAAVALYFAVHPREDKDGAVWLLDPVELNKLSGVTNLPASDMEPVKQSYMLAFGFAKPTKPPQHPIAVA
jgi:hypothetical protein